MSQSVSQQSSSHLLSHQATFKYVEARLPTHHWSSVSAINQQLPYWQRRCMMFLHLQPNRLTAHTYNCHPSLEEELRVEVGRTLSWARCRTELLQQFLQQKSGLFHLSGNFVSGIGSNRSSELVGGLGCTIENMKLLLNNSRAVDSTVMSVHQGVDGSSVQPIGLSRRERDSADLTRERDSSVHSVSTAAQSARARAVANVPHGSAIVNVTTPTVAAHGLSPAGPAPSSGSNRTMQQSGGSPMLPSPTGTPATESADARQTKAPAKRFAPIPKGGKPMDAQMAMMMARTRARGGRHFGPPAGPYTPSVGYLDGLFARLEFGL
jgi:hypothetical protein